MEVNYLFTSFYLLLLKGVNAFEPFFAFTEPFASSQESFSTPLLYSTQINMNNPYPESLSYGFSFLGSSIFTDFKTTDSFNQF